MPNETISDLDLVVVTADNLDEFEMQDKSDLTDSAEGTSKSIQRQNIVLTAAEVKTKYESNADTNEFSDAEESGLAGLLAGVSLGHLDTDMADSMMFLVGSYLDSPDVSVSSNGTTITLSLEKSGGGDLRIAFSTGFYSFDATPIATIALTPGTDTVPVLNCVYILESTKALTVDTGGWPAAEHAKVALVLCKTAATTQTENVLMLHAWTDHVKNSALGHLSHQNEWIREQHATWRSGVVQTLTITPNGGSADDVIFTTTAGVVLQLHGHTFPAFTGTPDLYVINDSVTPYKQITDLNELLTDSAGGTLSGRYFELTILGCVSEDTGDCKLFVNLPSGSYNKEADLRVDALGYVDRSVPANFKGTMFLISGLQLRHQAAASGTWTSIDPLDLRSVDPNVNAGTASATNVTEYFHSTSLPTNFVNDFQRGGIAIPLPFDCNIVSVKFRLGEGILSGHDGSNYLTLDARYIPAAGLAGGFASATSLVATPKQSGAAEFNSDLPFQEFDLGADQNLVRSQGDIIALYFTKTLSPAEPINYGAQILVECTRR